MLGPQLLDKSDVTMLELDAHNTLDYLRQRGDVWLPDDARVELLGWGVSNVVLRVIRPGADDFIIKQSRTQLRTKTEWFSRLDRIYREIGMLHLLAPLLPAGVIPRVLFEDRDNYLFGMEAFPAQHVVWKQALLNGDVDLTIADRLGEYLSAIHGKTSNRPDLAVEWGDLEVFDQLRLDPFYRYLARVRPESAQYLERLIEENISTRHCIVLADFSPKNILLSGDRIALVDFETGHYGDPAFDLGFFLSHLLLKAVHFASRFDDYAELTQRFWRHYSVSNGRSGGPMQRESVAPAERYHQNDVAGNARLGGSLALPCTRQVNAEPSSNSMRSINVQAEPTSGAPSNDLFRRTQQHLAGCMWARVDGKSPVDYLTRPASQQHVRAFCLDLFQAPASSWNEVLARLQTGHS